MSIDAALAAMEDYRLGTADVVPDGWYTVKQLADARGVSTDCMGRTIRKMEGRFEKKLYRVRCVETVRPVLHYRLKA